MFRIYDKIRRTGRLTEPLPPAGEVVVQLGATFKKEIAARFGGSLAIRMVDAGSCNGCELEMHALNNGFYDIERFGIHFVASPATCRRP